jgi:hypothetical protein
MCDKEVKGVHKVVFQDMGDPEGELDGLIFRGAKRV